jgi:hypothetical protein
MLDPLRTVAVKTLYFPKGSPLALILELWGPKRR